MSYDQDAVDAANELLRPLIRANSEAIDALYRRVELLEARPTGSGLFEARDNLETAMFAAMAGMTDSEQVEYMNALAARIKANA